MELEQLKTWANEKCTETFAIDEMEFYANIPSILECEHCKTTGKRFNGHHVKYCWELKIAAQQQHEDAENSPTLTLQQINQESSQSPLPEKKRNEDGKKEKQHKSLKPQNIETKQLNQPVQDMQSDLETTKWIANTEKMIKGSENSSLVSLGRVLRNRQHRKAETDQNSDKKEDADTDED